MYSISKKYPLCLKNAVWVKITTKKDVLQAMLYRVVSTTKYAITMNRPQFQWFTEHELPPHGQMDTLRSEITSLGNNTFSVRLQHEQTSICISNEAWEQLKIVLQAVVNDYDIIIPRINNLVRTADRPMLRQLLLACATHSYLYDLGRACKLCKMLYPVNDEDTCDENIHCCYTHNPKCRSNQYKLAADALKEFSENDLQMLLLANGFQTTNLSMDRVIGHNQYATIDLIFDHQCYYPFSEALIKNFIAETAKFM